MNKVKYIIGLEEEKAQLERKLALINGKINTQREACSHVSVDLGYSKYRWWILLFIMWNGKKSWILLQSKIYMVHAEDYLPQYDIKDDEQRIAKFEHIQILAIGILKENPKMSNEELVSKLNNLIQESISYNKSQSGPKLVKTRNQKK